MRLASLSVLILLACGPDPEREHTECGMYLGGDWTKHDNSRPETGTLPLAELQVIETKTIEVAARLTKDWRLQDSERFCKQMKGFIIYTAKTTDKIAETYSGLTICPTREIMLVDLTPIPWFRSAAAHELLHVGQNCLYALPDEDGRGAPYHENWFRDGEYSTIDTVQAELAK